jgi:hypothetical protein
VVEMGRPEGTTRPPAAQGGGGAVAGSGEERGCGDGGRRGGRGLAVGAAEDELRGNFP